MPWIWKQGGNDDVELTKDDWLRLDKVLAFHDVSILREDDTSAQIGPIPPEIKKSLSEALAKNNFFLHDPRFE